MVSKGDEGREQILCYLFEQVNILGIWILLVNNFWVPPRARHNKIIGPQCHKRPLVAHSISKMLTIKRISRCCLMLIKLNEIIEEVPILPSNKKYGLKDH